MPSPCLDALGLGSVSSESQSVLFSINLAQEQAVQFDDGSGARGIENYWTTRFGDDFSAVAHIYSGFGDVSNLSAQLDHKIQSDSFAAAGGDYATLTSLAVRLHRHGAARPSLAMTTSSSSF